MPTSRFVTNATVGGITFRSTATREADGQIGHQATLPAAIAGTITSNAAGAYTLALVNSYADNTLVDVYWDGGARYGMQVTTPSGTAPIIEDGSAVGGDAMPADSTAITVCEQTIIDLDVVGTNVNALAAICEERALVNFFDSGGVELALELTADELYQWMSDSGVTNPITGDTITHVLASQAATSTAVLKLGLGYDSTS